MIRDGRFKYPVLIVECDNSHNHTTLSAFFQTWDRFTTTFRTATLRGELPFWSQLQHIYLIKFVHVLKQRPFQSIDWYFSDLIDGYFVLVTKYFHQIIIWIETAMRDRSWYGLSQWETALHCNVSFRWLGLYPQWSLPFCNRFFLLPVRCNETTSTVWRRTRSWLIADRTFRKQVIALATNSTYCFYSYKLLRWWQNVIRYNI